MVKKVKLITEQELKMCLGKVKHKSELAAQNQLHHDIELVDIKETLNYYKCPYCKYYHIGHSNN